MVNPITLPSGARVTLRPAEDVSERLQRPIRRALGRIRAEVLLAGREAASQEYESEEARQAAAETAALQVGITSEEIDAFSDAQDLTIVALVESWAYDGPDERVRGLYAQPITADSVQDLPARDYRMLQQETAKRSNAMFGLDTSLSLDPASPSAPSNGSSSASVEGPWTAPQRSGVPTAS